jgi:sulfide:quinone oxidoreductase
MTDSSPHRVLIAGSGVAGLEALIALHGLAGDRIETSVLSPDPVFFFQAHSVEEPFARPAARRWSVPDMCAAHDAAYVSASVTAVDAEAGYLTTSEGDRLAFDSLLIAVGARRQRAFEAKAIVFTGDREADAMHGLIQDVEQGYAKRIAFVVPSGVTWPLPLYELALMTAQRASEMGEDVSLVFVTPEELPLAIFGQHASGAVAAALEDAGIALRSHTRVRGIEGGNVVLDPDGERLGADRVVTVPILRGPAIAGVTSDDDGFVRIDDHCRVRGFSNVFAAGDGTVVAVKQGGLAAQQADVAALGIAQRSGADVEPITFEPNLRAKLLTGTRAKYLRRALDPDGGESSSTAADHALWWPPSKVAAPHLAAYLDAVERGAPPPSNPITAEPVLIHVAGDPAGGIELLEPQR